MVINRALEYNRQQLSSIEIAYAQQISTFEFLMERIYAVQPGSEGTIYDSIQILLSSNEPFVSAEEYNEYVRNAYNIFTFFRLVQSSLQTEISLFQIKGAEKDQGNINILWPVDNIGMVEYAREIDDFIEIVEETVPIHQDKTKVFSFISNSGPISRRYFYVIYDYIIDRTRENKVIGYLINGYNTSDLNRVLQSFSSPLVGTAYILDSNGIVIYSSNLSMIGNNYSFFPEIKGTSEPIVRMGANIYNIIYNQEFNFYTIGEIPNRILTEDAGRRNISILLLSFLSATAAFLLSLLSTQSLKRRVKSIIKTMSIAERGDLSTRAELSPYNDELDRIASGLNSMITNINEHINTVYLSELQRKNAEIKQREAEFNALQAEINPHFLYNTLESIRMQALLNGDQDTALLIRLLATLFRNRIKSGNVVKIKDEIIHCKSLIEILSSRYGGKIELSLNISKEMEEYGILRDLIHPILENAFIHGFREEYEREKHLELSGTLENGIINIRVKNSGEPIEELKLWQIKNYLEDPDSGMEGESNGLLNVHQRSRLVYGDEFGINIDTNMETGTIVDLKIQALTVEELKEKVS